MMNSLAKFVFFGFASAPPTLKGLDFVYYAQPFCWVATTQSTNLALMDFPYRAQPFVSYAK